MFFGVSTIALFDGETTLLTDGFFSRPSAQQVLAGRVSPNHAAIDEALQKAGIGEAAAVLVAHSHYDHALMPPRCAGGPARHWSAPNRHSTSVAATG